MISIFFSNCPSRVVGVLVDGTRSPSLKVAVDLVVGQVEVKDDALSNWPPALIALIGRS
jgi:hypothetical protein